jgi:hypothetical protein
MSTNYEIMTPEEVAQYLRKSRSWVYKNAKLLGGKKLRGVLLFPSREDIYERVFHQGQRVERGIHPQRKKVFNNISQDESRSETGGREKKGGYVKPATADSRENPNRHGLLGAC